MGMVKIVISSKIDINNRTRKTKINMKKEDIISKARAIAINNTMIIMMTIMMIIARTVVLKSINSKHHILVVASKTNITNRSMHQRLIKKNSMRVPTRKKK